MFSANIVAQVIPFLVAPILTRLYSPENLGVFAAVMSVASVLSVFASGKYELAIIVAKSERERQLLTTLCIALLLAFTVAIGCLCLWGGGFINTLMPDVDTSQVCLFLPCFVLAIGGYNIFVNLANSRAEYKSIATNLVYHSILNNGLALALAPLTGLGLLFGFAVSRACTAVLLLSSKAWSDQLALLVSAFRRTKRYVVLAKRYSRFPIYSVPSDALDAYTKQIPVLLLSLFSSAFTIGLFALTDRVLSRPLTIVGKAISMPFRNRAADDYNQHGSCRQIVLKVLFLLVGVSALPFLVLYLFSPGLFGWFFGYEWTVAGEYARILVPIFFLQFVTSPLTFVFHIANKQHVDFYLHLLMTVLLTASFVVGLVYFDSFALALKLYAASYVFTYLIYIYCSIKFSTADGANMAGGHRGEVDREGAESQKG